MKLDFPILSPSLDFVRFQKGQSLLHILAIPCPGCLPIEIGEGHVVVWWFPKMGLTSIWGHPRLWKTPCGPIVYCILPRQLLVLKHLPDFLIPKAGVSSETTWRGRGSDMGVFWVLEGGISSIPYITQELESPGLQ